MKDFDLRKYLKEGKLYEIESLDDIKSIEVTYTERGRFYKIDVEYKDGSSDNFKDINALGIDLPYRYSNSSLEKIAKEMEQKDIMFNYNDAFDPS
jgi:hypothetical protein